MALNINSEKIATIDDDFVILDNDNINSQSHNVSNYMGPVEKYELEWNDLSIIAEDQHLNNLRQIAIDGNLMVSKFRSICWALLLKVLTGNSNNWLKQRRHDRIRYQEIRSKFNLNPHKVDDTQDNPLSQSEKSVWNQHFCDLELCAVIKQDVVRTLPGVDFYRKPRIQEIMTNILFYYAREYPEMCYRQGMHEILAPILFVIQCDHQSLLHVRSLEPTLKDPTIQIILEPKYLEADAYFIFSTIMAEIESYYRVNDMTPSSTGYFPLSKLSPQDTKKSELEIVGQLNNIRDQILAKVDLQLNNHLIQLDIPLPIFGIRWLRLLFGREFPLQDLLIIWDAIFAEGSNFELTNYIVVAMLMKIRRKLLESDYTTCLTYLMKYPGNIDVAQLIRHAMQLKAPNLPNLQPNPIPTIKQNVVQTKKHPVSTKPNNHNRSATMPRYPVETKSHPDSTSERRGTASSSAANLVRKSTNEQIKILNTIQSTRQYQTQQSSGSNGEIDPGIIDGYLEDSPELLKIQLQNAFTLMSISRIKLAKYVAVLRKHIPGNSTDEIHQTLDGLEELCALLKIKTNTTLTLSAPVDCAFEVNEPTKNEGTKSKPTSLALQKSTQSAATAATSIQTRTKFKTDRDSKKEFIHNLKRSELEIVATDDANLVLGISDQFAADKPIDSLPLINNNRCRYEKPEDHTIGRTATKILGDRREVELHEISVKSLKEEIRDFIRVPNTDPSGERDDSPIKD